MFIEETILASYKKGVGSLLDMKIESWYWHGIWTLTFFLHQQKVLGKYVFSS